MADKVEQLLQSTIQHGAYNSRIYLMKLYSRDIPAIFSKMDELSEKNSYTKIFTRVPEKLSGFFKDNGYVKEAEIPGFFNSINTAAFMSKFLSPERKKEKKPEEVKKNIELAKAKFSSSPAAPALPPEFEISPAVPKDAEEMAEVYKVVFKTYPFPIHDPEYLKKTMKENIIYFCARTNGKIAALSSAETYENWQAVEMTDFATLPDYLGNGLAVHLLFRMEHEMKEKNYITAYTIARALSPGMNITFSKMGYNYSGTLVNNTNIFDGIESMNVWYKHLK